MNVNVILVHVYLLWLLARTASRTCVLCLSGLFTSLFTATSALPHAVRARNAHKTRRRLRLRALHDVAEQRPTLWNDQYLLLSHGAGSFARTIAYHCAGAARAPAAETWI